jgi:hypothetical protein
LLQPLRKNHLPSLIYAYYGFHFAAAHHAICTAGFFFVFDIHTCTSLMSAVSEDLNFSDKSDDTEKCVFSFIAD